MKLKKTRKIQVAEYAVITLVLLATVIALTIIGQAQTSPLRLVKLPNGDYTIPISELRASGMRGNVEVHPEGLKTLVTVYVFGGKKRMHAFNLVSGSDCVASSAVSGVSLAPALTGEPSKTLVAVPIEALRSKNYLIVVGDATTKHRFEEACAKF